MHACTTSPKLPIEDSTLQHTKSLILLLHRFPKSQEKNISLSSLFASAMRIVCGWAQKGLRRRRGPRFQRASIADADRSPTPQRLGPHEATTGTAGKGATRGRAGDGQNACGKIRATPHLTTCYAGMHLSRCGTLHLAPAAHCNGLGVGSIRWRRGVPCWPFDSYSTFVSVSNSSRQTLC
jgi:hypothetical protein